MTEQMKHKYTPAEIERMADLLTDAYQDKNLYPLMMMHILNRTRMEELVSHCEARIAEREAERQERQRRAYEVSRYRKAARSSWMIT